MNLKPVVMDMETSGLDLVNSGIWQIGAIDLNTMEEFLEESRIDNEDIISPGALKVTGKTEEDLRNPKKQSQKELFLKFVNWLNERKFKSFLCQIPMWDVGWLHVRLNKYNLEMPFRHRSFDLHSIAQAKFHDVHSKFLIHENHSEMSLMKVLEFCGIQDPRNTHNALEDCKLTAECFSRLIYGKNLFSEYSQFPIPEYLRRSKE